MSESLIFRLVIGLYSSMTQSLLFHWILQLWKHIRQSTVYSSVSTAQERLFAEPSNITMGGSSIIQWAFDRVTPVTGWLHQHFAASGTAHLLFRKLSLHATTGVVLLFALMGIVPPEMLLLLTLAAVGFGSLYTLYRTPNLTLVPSALDRTVWLIWFVMTAASITSVDVRLSWISYVIFTASFMSAYLVAYAVQSTEHLSRVLLGLNLALLLIGGYAMLQFTFLDISNNSWVDATTSAGIDKRVYSFLGNPNVLAVFLVMVVPLASGLIFYAKSNWIRFVCIAATLLSLLTIMLTFSRGGWLAAAVAVGFMVLLYPRLFLLIPIAAGVPVLLFFDKVAARISSFTTADSSVSYRLYIWRSALEMIEEYGWSGMGYGGYIFHKMYQLYGGAFAITAYHAHNFFLEMIIEIGYFGMGALLLIFAQILYLTISNLRACRASLAGYVTMGCCAGLMGMLVYGVADHVWGSTNMIFVFWLVVGLFMAAHRMMQQKQKEENPTS